MRLKVLREIKNLRASKMLRPLKISSKFYKNRPVMGTAPAPTAPKFAASNAQNLLLWSSIVFKELILDESVASLTVGNKKDGFEINITPAMANIIATISLMETRSLPRQQENKAPSRKKQKYHSLSTAKYKSKIQKNLKTGKKRVWL